MAIRFAAAADRLSNATALAATNVNGFAYTAWIKIVVDRDDYSTWLRFSNAGSTIFNSATESNGTQGPYCFTPTAASPGIASDLSAPSTGVWVPVAMIRNASTGTPEFGTTGDPVVFRKTSGTGTTVSANADMATTDLTSTIGEVCFGGRQGTDASEWFSGDIAFVRVWSTPLTQAEIEAEWASVTPVKTSGLTREWPLCGSGPQQLYDVKGNAQLATQSGGAPVSVAMPATPFGSGPVLKFADYQRSGNSGGSSAVLTSASFTPANGDVIVVKANTWDTGTAPGTPSGGSQTFTSRVDCAPGGFKGRSKIYTATVSGSPGSMTVALSAPASSSHHDMTVEVWTNAQLAATPATVSDASGSSAGPSATITTTGTDSIVSWCSTDINSRDPSTRAYRSGAVESGISDGSVGNNEVYYSAWQLAATAGSQTVGLTTPNTQSWTLAGVEIQKASAGGSALTGSATDAAGLTDSATRVHAASQAQTDPAGLTDSRTQVTASARAQTDPAGLVDSVSYVAGGQQAITDPAGLTDSTSQAQGWATSATDPLGLTDSVSYLAVQSKSMTDGATLGESYPRAMSQDQGADALGLADSVTFVAGQQITVTDALGLLDPLAQTGSFAPQVTDSLGVLDPAGQLAAYGRVTTDPLGSVDGATAAGTGALSVTISDTLGIADAFAALLAASRTLSDALGALDLASTGQEVTYPRPRPGRPSYGGVRGGRPVRVQTVHSGRPQ